MYIENTMKQNMSYTTSDENSNDVEVKLTRYRIELTICTEDIQVIKDNQVLLADAVTDFLEDNSAMSNVHLFHNELLVKINAMRLNSEILNSIERCNKKK